MLRFLTAGESHGQALVGILDGIPKGVPLCQKDFSDLMKKRWDGYRRSPRKNIENDSVEILSGVRFGKTLGSPIGLLIKNLDYQNHIDSMNKWELSPDYKPLTTPLPGHADYAGGKKFNTDDFRDIRERASARETAMRNALSVPARKLLFELGVRSAAFVRKIGSISSNISENYSISEVSAALEQEDASAFLTPDLSVVPSWKNLVDSAAEKGQTLGGMVEVCFGNLPPGIGSHTQSDLRIDSRLAAIVLSIPGVKAVEFGEGILQSQLEGASAHDSFYCEDGEISRKSNMAGGIEGGMTNGMPLVIRAFMKPLPSTCGLSTVDIKTMKTVAVKPERTDVMALPALAITLESVISIEIASALIENFSGNTLEKIKDLVS
ncbi:MAG: chorismate synthase [Candidatus Riflebacteria bacterium]|nr:chorismate synthase [Candidatus Riflebacteria bacterium]